MDNLTDRLAALAAISRTEAEANVARAMVVFDAIDEQSPRLSEHDRYDAAYAAWQTCVDLDGPIPDEDIARLTLRTARHIPEEQLIDLVDVQLGEQAKEIRIDEHHGLTWMPDDDCLILTYPSNLAGTVVEAVLVRARRLHA